VRTLIGMCATAFAFAFFFSLIPPATYKEWRLYCLQPIVEGVMQVSLYTIPESMLADVIDYDELWYGRRREGVFVVFDINIMQLMDIVAGVIPGIILSAVGYRGNGGCACGCGVKCPASYMRWSCPADIGYACTTDLSDNNPPFMGNATRTPPCTVQQETVENTLQMFFFTIPAVCFALATYFAYQTPITPGVYQSIKDELQRRKEGHDKLFDPVTFQVIEEDRKSEKEQAIIHVIDSFGSDEQVVVVQEGGVRRLRVIIILKLFGAVAAMVGVVVATQILALPKLFNSIAIFVSSLILMLVLWQALKLATLLQSTHELTVFANSIRFERSQFGGNASFRGQSGMRFGGRGRSEGEKGSAKEEKKVAEKDVFGQTLSKTLAKKVRARTMAWAQRAMNLHRAPSGDVSTNAAAKKAQQYRSTMSFPGMHVCALKKRHTLDDVEEDDDDEDDDDDDDGHGAQGAGSFRGRSESVPSQVGDKEELSGDDSDDSDEHSSGEADTDDPRQRFVPQSSVKAGPSVLAAACPPGTRRARVARSASDVEITEAAHEAAAASRGGASKPSWALRKGKERRKRKNEGDVPQSRHSTAT